MQNVGCYEVQLHLSVRLLMTCMHYQPIADSHCDAEERIMDVLLFCARQTRRTYNCCEPNCSSLIRWVDTNQQRRQKLYKHPCNAGTAGVARSESRNIPGVALSDYFRRGSIGIIPAWLGRNNPGVAWSEYFRRGSIGIFPAWLGRNLSGVARSE